MIFDKPSQAIDVSEFATKEYVNQIVGAYTTGYTLLLDVDYDKIQTNGSHYYTPYSKTQSFSIPSEFFIYKMQVTTDSSFSGYGAGYSFTQNISKTALEVINGGGNVLLGSYRRDWNVEGNSYWFIWSLYVSLSNNTLNLTATCQDSGQFQSGVQWYVNAGTLPLTLKLFA